MVKLKLLIVYNGLFDRNQRRVWLTSTYHNNIVSCFDARKKQSQNGGASFVTNKRIVEVNSLFIRTNIKHFGNFIFQVLELCLN